MFAEPCDIYTYRELTEKQRRGFYDGVASCRLILGDLLWQRHDGCDEMCFLTFTTFVKNKQLSTLRRPSGIQTRR